MPNSEHPLKIKQRRVANKTRERITWNIKNRQSKRRREKRKQKNKEQMRQIEKKYQNDRFKPNQINYSIKCE